MRRNTNTIAIHLPFINTLIQAIERYLESDCTGGPLRLNEHALRELIAKLRQAISGNLPHEIGGTLARNLYTLVKRSRAFYQTEIAWVSELTYHSFSRPDPSVFDLLDNDHVLFNHLEMQDAAMLMHLLHPKRFQDDMIRETQTQTRKAIRERKVFVG